MTVQAVGECMVEIVRHDGKVRISYSGDTYNTAVYLRRTASELGVPVEVRYLTGVGDDDESTRMRACWHGEGIEDDAVVINGATPGLYMIRTDDDGERSFSYWRSDSAAAVLFSGRGWIDAVRGSVVYLSGITLQLMTAGVRDALVGRLDELRRTGTRVAFDTNFRPSGWPDVDTGRAAMDQVLAVTDVALVSWEDERLRTGAADIAAHVAALARQGVAEIVVKDGPRGAWVHDGGALAHEAARPVAAVDTTAAGDSFNGAYLAARLAGQGPREAARSGHRLAEQVVQHPGAILEPAATPAGAR
ncbi:sugar kinase [Marmoricola sp. RAF53]|uniref:sugar kinase n=1 Tax=Marmoricola sp. RAF53 TaxID=3233059 RepID=UPI003F94ECB0